MLARVLRLASAYHKDLLVPQDLQALAPHVVHLGLVGAEEHAVVPRAIHYIGGVKLLAI